MNRVRRLLAATGLKTGEGIMVHKPSNVFYLSGFTGEGLLVIGMDVASIVTDFRYTEQAESQAPGWKVHMISGSNGHVRVAAGLLEEAGVTRALYEDEYVTVRTFQEMKQAMPHVSFTPLGAVPETLRGVKEDGELALMRRACDISSDAFDYICGVIRPGMTEKEIRLALDFHLLETGAEALAFSTIVASGPNGSLPHAVPSDRKVGKGDLITLDYGAKVGGYCADMTRTVALGDPPPLMREVYGIVLDAQKASQEALAPGKACRDIDAVARERIAEAGYASRFGHGLGHSVGIDVHEEPRLNTLTTQKLFPGNVVTVEPGIYLPGTGGVRIENLCLVTSEGGESLIRATRDLLVL